jgi:hypothetical protein
VEPVELSHRYERNDRETKMSDLRDDELTQTEIKTILERIDALGLRLGAEIAAFRTELLAEIGSFRSELHTQIGSVRVEMSIRLDRMESEVKLTHSD